MPTTDQVLENTVRRCRERNIIIPTYREMRNPELIPEGIRAELAGIGLWDLDPRNLFRITWKNEPVASGGGFGGVNFVELPPAITGVPSRIVMLIGKYFPTGAHKVGATFGPLVEKLVRGAFDPTTQKALWPSTGNYCRGGAYDAYLLACPSIAVLPEGMSRERFEWLETVGSEIFATPGSESNVKEIYDKVRELKAERGDGIVVLNQFEEFGNAAWHYACTGPAMEEVFEQVRGPGQRFAAVCLTQGSAGTLGCADYLREVFPQVKVVAAEALQCPTLLYNGHGAHRIEGIGDKHVPWIHNLKNTDVAVGIDDEACMRLLRVFNEPAGRSYLESVGVESGLASRLDLLGISSIANLLTAVKTARYFEMGADDVLFTVATDSMEMYASRLAEERAAHGEMTAARGEALHERYLLGASIDHVLELGYWDRKRLHNLKYFTWVEQQGKSVEELDAQWHDPHYWTSRLGAWREWDERITEFNERTGLLQRYR
ncbi:MAG TPA: pyridoxal-phosphate dependent enzyme [Candidatus Sulfomarinibacteraceae bacterium]|nr:pyridoxal-phosphate dependent enzyme [Candidatus Sulfomarinibacteraceae bacterium]